MFVIKQQEHHLVDDARTFVMFTRDVSHFMPELCGSALKCCAEYTSDLIHEPHSNEHNRNVTSCFFEAFKVKIK